MSLWPTAQVDLRGPRKRTVSRPTCGRLAFRGRATAGRGLALLSANGLFCALFLCFCARGLAAEAVLLEVQAGRCDRQAVPVFFDLPETLRAWKGFQLLDSASGRPVPVQFERGERPRLAWMIDRLARGSTRRYRLSPQSDPGGPAPAVKVLDDERRLRVEVEGKPVLDYNHAVVPSDEPREPYYRRSGFIHPVYNPKGQVVTDGMPPDHMHQHGIMFPWVSTRFEGRQVDFWNSKKQQGEVRHVELVETQSGPVFASLTVRLEHVDLTAPAGPKVALRETWQVRVYRRTDGFLFDLSSTQTCAGSSPLTVNRFDYGGMAIRGARAWFGKDKCEFLTSEGKTRSDGNHTRARWCEMSGPLGGQACGITVLSHPRNFRSPQPLRLHPDKPYFCWAPMVLGDFTIEPGKPYASAYRYHVHDGKLDTAVADRLWADFAEPAAVRLVPAELPTATASAAASRNRQRLVLLAGPPTKGAEPVAGRLQLPFGVDADPQGNLLIVEFTGNRIRKLDCQGRLSTFAGTGEKGSGGDGGPAARAQFDGMHQLAVSPGGDVYIADTWNRRVRKIDARTGIITTVAGTGVKGFSGDGGPADRAQCGDLYCAALDAPRKRLLLADLDNRRIRVVTLADGRIATLAGNGRRGVPIDGALAKESPLVDPRAVAADAAGNVYILERGGHALRVVDPQGRIRTVAGTGRKGPAADDVPAPEATLNGPKHLCVDGQGDVIIADAENHVIRKYLARENRVLRIAGTGQQGSAGVGGPPRQAQLDRPHGVFVDSQGTLYIVDSGNDRILRVERE